MVYSIIKNTKISGISTLIPKKELSLLDDKNLYNSDKAKLDRVINSSGFLKRRVVGKNTTTADLCEKAANDLIDNLNIDKSTIDGLIFISYTPDYIMPATSYVLHNKLGLSKNCIVQDVPQACSGFVYGLWLAGMMLNSGCKKILLLVGDTFSKFTDMFNNNTAPVFGDAGSATILEYDENAQEMFFNINSDGSKHESLICSNGGFRNPPKKDNFYPDGTFKYNSKMDGAEIFNFTLEEIPSSIESVLNYAGIEKNDIDYFVLHQANKFILQTIADTINVDYSKIPMNTLTKYGNQCGASIPCTISDNLKKEVTGKNLKLALCGFGVGLSWISAIINLKKIYCSDLIEYEG